VNVPFRLTVQFGIARRPLVSVKFARQEGGTWVGAGTRSVDLTPTREFDLVDPDTGAPTGERITVARALAILNSFSRS
jgi:hypothetical protein